MANYNYDEGGQMAAYFIISFLALFLVPLTLSSLSNSSSKKSVQGCQCRPCLEQRAQIRKRERGSIFNPNLSKRTIFLFVGWTIFGYLVYKVADAKLENKVYDPFEILGIHTGSTEKEIKSHYKKLSKKFHPDKVKPTGNDTIESIAARFVQITKAYKSLTDETIRKNWELYGHPDGRQELSMGIALPQWIVEAKNNVWVLGFYGLIFGGMLPFLVGRWWFGSRQKTKDGIHAKSAAVFFKSIREDAGMHDVVSALGKAYQYEQPTSAKSMKLELEDLDMQITKRAGKRWTEVRKLVQGENGGRDVAYESRWKALVLIYCHLLRIPVTEPALQREQTQILLQTPLLLNALLQISISRNWLLPTLAVMRLHAYLTQALLPTFPSPASSSSLGLNNAHEDNGAKFAQLPGVQGDEALELLNVKEGGMHSVEELVEALEKKDDTRIGEIRKAVASWGRVELVDASFKVIGERIVTPGSIVFLIVKLRLAPPADAHPQVESVKEHDVEETKRRIKANEEKDLEFLMARKEVEDLPNEEKLTGWAHAPYWPGNRKPSWWVVLADDKTNRVVVPPMKVTDVPLFPDASSSIDNVSRHYRMYKMQFQAPQSVGLFTWKLYILSDTYIGDDVTSNIQLKIEDLSALNADERGDGEEDEISDPDEDSLAGQMAAMRGGKVKKRTEEEEESDDESGTDDDEKQSSSDSDSD